MRSTASPTWSTPTGFSPAASGRWVGSKLHPCGSRALILHGRAAYSKLVANSTGALNTTKRFAELRACLSDDASQRGWMLTMIKVLTCAITCCVCCVCAALMIPSRRTPRPTRQMPRRPSCSPSQQRSTRSAPAGHCWVDTALLMIATYTILLAPVICHCANERLHWLICSIF